MTVTSPDAARARARAARDRMFQTLGTVQERLKPANLAQEAMDTARQRATEAAREGARVVRTRPWLVAATSGAIGLILARGWIADLVWRRHKATDTPDGGLDDTNDSKAKG